MNFSQALESIKLGSRVAREGWNGKGMWVELQQPDAHSKMTRPYIYMTLPAGATKQFGEREGQQDQRVPWLASQTDYRDWETDRKSVV